MANEPKNIEPNMFVHSSAGSFTTMRNFHLRDTSISLKACGLLSKMLSLPPDWNFTIEGLASLTRDGRDSVNSAIKELKEHGYISTSNKFGPDGRFCGVRYDIYESPHPENPDTEKPNTENPQLLNTNKSITNELSTNEHKEKDIDSVPSSISKEKNARKRFSGVNPSKEEVEAYIRKKNFHVSADRVINYYTNYGDLKVWKLKDGTLVNDWKRCVCTCESNWKEKTGNKPAASKDSPEESSYYAELTRQEREKDKEKSEEYIAKYGKLFEAI